MPHFADSSPRPVLALLLAALAACAPTRVVERDEDVQTGVRTQIGPGHDRKIVAVVRTDDDQASITLHSRDTCERYDQRALHRTHIVERHASVATQVLFYLGAAVGLGTGAWILADVPNIPKPNDPMRQNPVGRTGATVIGALQLVAGATCLALGIGTSVRGRTSRTNQGTVYAYVDGSKRSVECNRRVVAGEPIVLVAGDNRVELGRTDARGNVVVTWETVGPLYSKAAPSAGQVLVRDDTVATVELDAARAFWANRARDRALELAQADNVDEADAQADHAAALGADVSKVREAIARAPTSVQRREQSERKVREEKEQRTRQAAAHASAARQKLKRGDLEGARAEMQEARGLGADIEAIETEIARRADELVTRKARALFARCRKIARARDQFERVSHCDEGCQKIRRRIEQDWEHLNQQRLDLTDVSAERGEELKEMCQQAGCPACP